MKKKITIITVVLIYLLSCRSYNKNTERWEGLSETRLTIVLAEFFPFEENLTNDKITAIIKQRVDARASLILASHISINLKRNKISPKNDVALNKLINDAVISGKLINHYCTENNHCTATAEYDIIELLKKLTAINNQ